MDETVRELGQRFMAAVWNTARTGLTPDHADDLSMLVTVIQETRAQLDGALLHLVHEARLAAVNSVLDQVATTVRDTKTVRNTTLRLSDELADRYPLIGNALEEGTISLAQTAAMVKGMRTLPVKLTRADLAEAQRTLLHHAETLDPAELQILATRLMELLDPATAEHTEAERLAREERQAHRTRFLRLHPDHHGSTIITGQLPVADAALLAAQLDAVTPPITSYRETEELPGPDIRRADALVALCQHAATTGTLPSHGVDRPQVRVTIPLTALLSGLGEAGVLDGGQQISAAEARRVACDADLIPAVLGAASQPLDVGRKDRFFTKALRAALILRDGGCAFPSCQAHPTQCEGHHITPWWAGGITALSNGVLLCPFHHRLVEPDPRQSTQSQWLVHLDPDTGRPWFTPPRHIDPTRSPRQHRRFTLDDILTPHSKNAPRITAPPWPPPETQTRAPAPARPNPWHPEPAAIG